MNASVASRKPISALGMLAFAWSIICPLALQSVVLMLHSTVSRDTSGLAIVRFATGNLTALRFVLFGCVAATLAVIVYCACDKRRDWNVAALAVTLLVGATSLSIVTLLAVAVAI